VLAAEDESSLHPLELPDAVVLLLSSLIIEATGSGFLICGAADGLGATTWEAYILPILYVTGFSA
jgi:hypothetical protein